MLTLYMCLLVLLFFFLFCYYIRLGASGPIVGKTRLSTGGGYLVPHPPPTKVWIVMVM